MENVKWIFFDMGSTLLNEEKSFAVRIERCIQAEKELGREVAFDQIYCEMCKATKELRTQFYGALDILGIRSKIPYPAEFDVPYEEAVTVLSELHKKYKIGIIANQPGGAQDRLKKFGLSEYIDLCLGSDDVGVEKPDPMIFRMALEKSSCSAENAVMIGDRLDNDIFPAKQLGFQTVWIKQGLAGKYQFPKSEEYEPDIVVDSLTELLRVLN